MEPAALSALAATVGSALVGAMTTDAWEGMHTRIAALFGRGDKATEQQFEAQLGASRTALDASAELETREGVALAEIEGWIQRINHVLETDESFTSALSSILDLLTRHYSPQSPTIQRVTAQRDAYTAARDLHISINRRDDDNHRS